MNALKIIVSSVVLYLFTYTSLQAQELAIKGVVIDIETMKPMQGVTLEVEELHIGATTDMKGEFALKMSNAKPKIYSVKASMVGFAADSSQVDLSNEKEGYVSLSLISESSELEEVVITRRREQVSEIALLGLRKNSNLMLELIGAQELSRKGISDAATAVSKITGVSRQDGSSQLYVRGLGDRYNSSTLNGLPIPSHDPNMKNIALEMFPTDVVDYIGVDKVSNVRIPGDFGGASIDIVSKNYVGGPLLEFDLGSNINTNALGQADNFLLQDGPNYFGFSGDKIPEDAQGSYHFRNSWDPSRKPMVPMNLGLKLGNSFQLKNGGRLSLFAAGNFSNAYGYRTGLNANLNAQGAPIKSFTQTQYSYNTNTSGIFNANYQINPGHKLSYNMLYINSGNQFVDRFQGFIRDAAENYNGQVNRNTFSQTSLFVNQLLGTHKLGDRYDLNWGIALNNVNGDMPDRTQSMIQQLSDGSYRFIRMNQPDNHRYTYLLKEKEYAANLALNYTLDDEKGKISIGYNGRMKKRSFDVMQLNFDLGTDLRNTAIDPNNLDQYLGADGFGVLYTVKGFAGNAYQYYNGDQDIHALFASLDYSLTDKLTAVMGFRYENIMQYVDYYSIEFRRGDNRMRKNGFLPSVNLKYALDDQQNLRFGASKTYTLPQFKERAWFPYEDVTQTYFGNPNLYASDNYNVDLKWEWFPKSTEIISASLFSKYIQNPINDIMVASATNDISYVNIGDSGFLYGLELEVKKDILSFNEDRSVLSVGFNTALMRAKQDIDADKVSRETEGMISIDPNSTSSRMTGASDYIVNADLSYLKKWGNEQSFTATVLYNYFSDKIFAIGTGGLGDRVDKGVNTLDFVFKSNLTRHIGANLTVRNILDPEYQRWQENADPVKILSYKKGQYFNLGINYKF